MERRARDGPKTGQGARGPPTRQEPWLFQRVSIPWLYSRRCTSPAAAAPTPTPAAAAAAAALALALAAARWAAG